jgi:hypothetical protein
MISPEIAELVSSLKAIFPASPLVSKDGLPILLLSAFLASL